jgi:hypothetical protein
VALFRIRNMRARPGGGNGDFRARLLGFAVRGQDWLEEVVFLLRIRSMRARPAGVNYGFVKDS